MLYSMHLDDSMVLGDQVQLAAQLLALSEFTKLNDWRELEIRQCEFECQTK